MGRKIPAKKHRGVKDPLEQQARRERSLKSKINAPPKDPDEQPVPRSLIRLFAFQDKKDASAKQNQNKIKKPVVGHVKQARGAKGASGGDNPVGRLRRAAGESAREFSLRIAGAVRALHAPLQADRYPGDIEEEDLKGEWMAEQRARRRRKRRTEPGGTLGATDDTRARRHALKKKEKIEKLQERRAAEERAEVRYERVPFGEVAAAPPALAPSRRTRAHIATRPGQRALLLSPLLAGGAGAGGVDGGAGAGAGARDAAVAAYRALVASRRRDAPRARRKHAARNHTL